MEKNLNELEYVEQELADLRNHLQRLFTVLETLAKIPAEFEELGDTHKQLKENLNQVKDNQEKLTNFKASVNQRLAELETVTNSKAIEFNAQLARLQDELSSADILLSNYNAQLAKQVSEIREDVTNRLSGFWQEWTTNRATQSFLSEIIDAKLNTELEAFVQHLSDAGFNAQHFERQETLETELRLTQSSLQEVERQLQLVRNFTTITGVTVAITLSLVIIQLVTNRAG